MEVIVISSDAYRELVSKIDNIALAVSKASFSDQPLAERWLDVQETCMALKISKRTLQVYRDNKILPFSQIAGKIYFKAKDIQAHLENNYRPLRINNADRLR